jgi:bifunctional ADP-heptose synthase (sugar kinase/adenylyltransferase)
MSALICGSFAYDTIMVFPDQFKNHILPDKVHMLNVAFLVPELRREFGGCAGNIAYNLKLLGDNPIPMGTVGDDSQVMLTGWISIKSTVTMFMSNRGITPPKLSSPPTWMTTKLPLSTREQ